MKLKGFNQTYQIVITFVLGGLLIAMIFAVSTMIQLFAIENKSDKLLLFQQATNADINNFNIIECNKVDSNHIAILNDDFCDWYTN